MNPMNAHIDSSWLRPRVAFGLGPAAGTAQVVACRPSYLSPFGWLGVQALALWPHGLWMIRRVQDGSDDPLGLAALAMLAIALWRAAPRLRIAPHTGWLAAAAAATAGANLALLVLPPLVCAGLAALALAAGLHAWLRHDVPRLPLAGLLLLALPLVASLQYYGGFPLRVLTAEASAWALQLGGIAAERSGTAMTVRGQLVIVDAPCSGVQMAWMAYFCACAFAAFTALRDGALLRRLPFVGALVLAGNIARNTVLVALESRPQGLDPMAHEAIGVVTLALVCAAVVALLRSGGRDGARA